MTAQVPVRTRLEAVLVARRLSARALAAVAQVSEATFSRAVRGEYALRGDALARLARHLDVPVADLIDPPTETPERVA